MNLEIALTLMVIVLVLIAFLREWAPPDVLAMTTLCLVVALGLVPMSEITTVFKNEAPITIAALFIIGGALEETGAIAWIGEFLRKHLKGTTRASMLGISIISAFTSAWMNNTAIVAILMPVVLGFARSHNLPAGRLLMPLSYASLLGGCSTLIGTSTNLLGNGILTQLGQRPMTMFELASVGIPVAIVGIAYLVILGPRLIPARSSGVATLELNHRAHKLHHVLVDSDSPLIGMRWTESPLASPDAGIHMLEIRRNGQRLTCDLDEIIIEKLDRFLITFHGGNAESQKLVEDQWGLTSISQIEGIVTELVLIKGSPLIGNTLADSSFRQRYNAVVLAVHRGNRNITHELGTLPLQRGDTLLIVTPTFNLGELQASHNFVLTDTPEDAKALQPKEALLTISALMAAVIVTSVSDVLNGIYPVIPKIPIHYAAIVAALIVLWARTISPRKAYQSVDWQVIFMLYGLLGLGMAMQFTGTANYLATGLVRTLEDIVSPEMLPYVLLWSIFLLTLLLTEVLSNSATIVMMLPLVIPIADELDVSARPLSIGIILASSLAFALPMGYQTHLMVYGPGGFRFSDFLRVGMPLNAICWITSCLLIPLIWPF